MPASFRALFSPAVAFVLVCGLAPRRAGADLDIAFVLDTTGSMGGEIREVQDRVRQLAESIARARPEERIRYGIVAFRDRGDVYITRSLPLTDDVPRAAEFLSSLQADGGGDGPESVVAALAAALREMPWDLSSETERQIFLVGDAPPHLDYVDDPRSEELIEEARRWRIAIHTIGCRSLPPHGVSFFRQMAYATEGSYQHIGRVRAAEPDALTRAVDRKASSGSAPGRGERIPVTWERHDPTPAPALLVRQGGPEGVAQSPEGEGLSPCSLEVALPVGLELGSEPEVRLAPRGLVVGLDLVEGEGGRDVFTLESCPPITVPVHLDLGGR